MKAALKKVGITGAGGNVGTTVHKGLAANYDLTLFDIREIRAPQGKFVKADCAEPREIAGQFNGLDALIHLAGDPRPNAPRRITLRNNFASASYAFEEARKAGVKKIVFASSNFYHEGEIGAALSSPDYPRITLDRSPTPQSLYGESKVYAESIGRHLSLFGVQFVALRIGWTVPQDNPAMYGGGYMRAVFCSHRDLVQAFTRALEVETDFMAAFVTSNNTHNVFDLAETRKNLGFNPQDNAENYF